MEEYEKSLCKAGMTFLEAQPIQNEYDNTDEIIENLEEVNTNSNSSVQPASVHKDHAELEGSDSSKSKISLIEQYEMNSEDSDFDDSELKDLEQEQLSRKVIERASKIINAENNGELEKQDRKRSLYGSWAAKLNLSNNQAEVR
jgi:hypothetical protein